MKLMILSIGENSIANYALIEYFKTHNDDIVFGYDKVLLISTKSRTNEISKRIMDLQKDISFETIELEKDEEVNFNKIKDKVLNKLKELNPTHIHYNYTGGRKPMSLGTFLAVENYENSCKKIYSDIDYSQYNLTLADGTKYPKDGDISTGLKIPISDIYLLHGLNEPKFKIEHSEFFSLDFCQYLFDKSINDVKNFYENLWDKDFDELKKLDYKKSIEDFVSNKQELTNKELKKLQDFIRGNWLEEYIFYYLKENKEEFNITDIAWNIEAKKEGNDFEVDVLAVCGYKTFLFTCTTATSKGVLKTKAFEGNKRSIQIAGIESHTILVCLANDKTLKIVKKDTGDKKFHIIGKEDIENTNNLIQNLGNIFK